MNGNELSGEIPPGIGGLAGLFKLDIGGNGLSGELPPELGGLANLETLHLAGNALSGCVPDALRDARFNDFAYLGLPFCEP